MIDSENGDEAPKISLMKERRTLKISPMEFKPWSLLLLMKPCPWFKKLGTILARS
jgi:hypothetical protein